MKWLATFVDDGAYTAAEAVLIETESDDPDEAAEEGLKALLDDFHDTVCSCEGPIANHVNVLPWTDVRRYEVNRTAVRAAPSEPT